MNSTRQLGLITMATAALFLGACGKAPVPESDTSAPEVIIASPSVSVSAEYELRGSVFDDTGVTGASYALGGAEGDLVLTDGSFNVLLTLAAGENSITVTARDAAGNTDTVSHTVLFGAAELLISSEAAMPGDSVDLAGAFGPGGSVAFGGAPGTVTSWSAEAISVEVPAAAPAGWTDVTVTSNTGTATGSIFVGTAFPVGALDDLAALALPAGTAVLLEAGTYTTDAATVTLDNLSLHGRGTDQTTIDTGATPKRLELQVDAGTDFVLSDLSLKTDGTGVVPGELQVAASESPFELFGHDSAFDLARALPFDPAGPLTTQASGTSVTLNNLSISDYGGMLPFHISDLLIAPSLIAAEVDIAGLQADTIGTILIVSSESIRITDSDIRSGGFIAIALGGGVSASNTTVDSASNMLPTGIVSTGGINLDKVDILSRAGDLAIGYTALIASEIPPAVSSSITGSTFRALEPDPGAALPDQSGNLQLSMLGGPTYMNGNTFVAQRNLGMDLGFTGIAIHDNSFSLGLAGVVSADLELWQMDIPGNQHVLRDNSFTWQSPGSVLIEGFIGQLDVRDNVFTGSSGTTALDLTHDDGFDMGGWSVTIADNIFTGFTNALRIQQSSSPTGPLTLDVSGNDFDLEFLAAPQVADVVDVDDAVITADGNRWGDLATAAAVQAMVLESGTTPAGTFVVNTVLAP